MCGIVGAWWRDPQPQGHLRIDAALEAMRRRGPDDRGSMTHHGVAGTTYLGQVRLSIIDLSAGGHQPMTTLDGAYSIVFNGEIYNYRELRSELRSLGRRFRSDSDTEVLLQAWSEWQLECLPKLIGMFAFAILEHRTDTLTLVRDPFGIKPLYYESCDDKFVFASDQSGLRAARGAKARLDWAQAYDYLVFGDYDRNGRSFMDGVSQLEPGCWLEVDLRSGRPPHVRRWWRPRYEERSSMGLEEAAERVREAFLDSVRLHLRSDVALGAALSGGVDSSAVVCAMRALEPDLPINTFSYIARGHSVSEERWVDIVNAHVGAIAHKVTLGPDDLISHLDEMITAQGEPFGSTSIYAQFRVFRLARENGITVTLDGQGADEMLAGYSGYPGPRIRSMIERGQWRAAWQFVASQSDWPGRSPGMAVKEAMSQLLPRPLFNGLRRLNGRMVPRPDWIDAGVLAEQGVRCGFPVVEIPEPHRGRRLAAELHRELTASRLPALLRHGDRNSMYYSIESRVPFLTPSLAELLLSLPEHFLVSPGGETKSVFRAAMRGIVPDAILDRRDKIGFDTPEREWLFQMKDTVREWLSVDIDVPFLRRDAVRAQVEAIFEGRRPYTWQVWRWINFWRWHALFVS